MPGSEIPPKISELLPNIEDRASLKRFVKAEVPGDGEAIHLALLSALAMRQHRVKPASLYNTR